MNKTPVAVIAGPTASGKTKLAVLLCKALNGEVVSADSMQIYQGMQIATAKPTVEEMGGIPHHLLDFQPLEKPFSVADYVQLARKTIADIRHRNKLPMIVGGTGLYIDSLLQGIAYTPSVNPQIRAEFKEFEAQHGSQALHEELAKVDPHAAESIHPHNVKRVVRALEMYRVTGKTLEENAALSHVKPSSYQACFLCLGFRDKEKLYQRIDARVDKMLEAGLVQEVKEALQNCGPTAVQAIGCKELLPYFAGSCTLGEAAKAIKQSTRHYAKRQLTWFRREKQAQWLWIDDYLDEEQLFQDALRKIQDFLKGYCL